MTNDHGLRFRSHRHKMKMSRHLLGSVFGVTGRTVSRWEAGETDFPTSVWMWAYKRGWPVEWILTGKEP